MTADCGRNVAVYYRQWFHYNDAPDYMHMNVHGCQVARLSDTIEGPFLPCDIYGPMETLHVCRLIDGFPDRWYDTSFAFLFEKNVFC